VRPLAFRLSQVFLKAETDAERRRRLPEAQAILARAKALPATDFAGFGRMARELSEDPQSKALDGDTRFLTYEELSERYGAAVATAGGALKALGDLSEVVQTPAGLQVLKLRGRQEATDLTLEQVRSTLLSRLQYERESAALEQLIDRLKAS